MRKQRTLPLSFAALATAALAHLFLASPLAAGLGGAVYGLVKDAVTQEPIPKAVVRINIGSGSATADTLPSGLFSLFVPEGTNFTVVASKPGYLTEAVRGVDVPANSHTPVDVFLTPEDLQGPRCDALPHLGPQAGDPARRRRIALRASNGRYVRRVRKMAADGVEHELVADASGIGEAETFYLLRLAEGFAVEGQIKVALAVKACCGRCYVSADRGREGRLIGHREQVQEWEQLWLRRLSDLYFLPVDGERRDAYTVALQDSRNLFVCADLGRGGALIADRGERKEWENFELVNLDPRPLSLHNPESFEPGPDHLGLASPTQTSPGDGTVVPLFGNVRQVELIWRSQHPWVQVEIECRGVGPEVEVCRSPMRIDRFEGRSATAFLPPAQSYSWRIRARDQGHWFSPWTGWRRFRFAPGTVISDIVYLHPQSLKKLLDDRQLRQEAPRFPQEKPSLFALEPSQLRALLLGLEDPQDER